MAENNQRKLRNAIVDWELQFRIIAGSLIVMLIAVIIILGVVLYPLLSGMYSANAETQYRAARDFLILIKQLIPVVILMFLFFTAHLLLITHRICGPLVNFSRTFAKLKEGNLSTRAYVRQDDYLKKECDKINEMIDGLSRMVSRITADQKKLIDNMEEIISRTDNLQKEGDLDGALTTALADARRIMDTLSQFRVDRSAPDQ